MAMEYPKLSATAHRFTLRFAVYDVSARSKTRGLLEFLQFVQANEGTAGIRDIVCGDMDVSVPAAQHVDAIRRSEDSTRVPRFAVERFVFTDRPVEDQFNETLAALAADGWEADLI